MPNMPADPGMNPNLFEPFDEKAVSAEDLISTSEARQRFNVSDGWLYDRIWPKGALHRIEIPGDRERYFVTREIEELRRPRLRPAPNTQPPPAP
jgi:hypothetical protein